MNTHAQGNKPPKRVFFAAVVMIFFTTVSAADSIGFVPSYIDGIPPQTEAPRGTVALSDLPQLSTPSNPVPVVAPLAVIGVEPERIKSAAIGLDVAITNPGTRDLAALDDAILKAPARYVDSAKLGVPGNMLIFAHSSTYQIVRNKMWKAFNRIHELKPGDTISVFGGGVEYVYSVTSVRSAKASEAVIDISPTAGTKLTLTTCDILTGKSARFIVEAEYVGMASTDIL